MIFEYSTFDYGFIVIMGVEKRKKLISMKSNSLQERNRKQDNIEEATFFENS
jgi:hypothetical protein